MGPREGQGVFVGHRARGGRGPGLGTDPKEAPGPPLDGVGLHSHRNGYGSDTKKGVCSERRCGAKKPHHGLQVRITTQLSHGVICEEPTGHRMLFVSYVYNPAIMEGVYSILG